MERKVRVGREKYKEVGRRYLMSVPPDLKDVSSFLDRGTSEPSDDVDNHGSRDHSSQSPTTSESRIFSSVSFGALINAQAGLQTSSTYKHLNARSENDNENTPWENKEAGERKAGQKDHRNFSRTSKHAPAELSSKKAVSRKRKVVPINKRECRDPRFGPLGATLDESKLQRAYSFLDNYRENEMKQLEEAIKKVQGETEKERLRRVLLSMESKKKSQQRKKKEAEILDKHRKEEKELVKEGKKPFYLKRAEQKKKLLMERYSELKGKHLEHVLERRRKKIVGKEKKQLPWSRRVQN